MDIKQNNLAEQFLLGKLTEEETVKIEEEIFSKNDQFENILIAEYDLIDAYVSGNLSAEDQSRFESRLLLNPNQHQRVEFAETLVNYASKKTAEYQDSIVYESSWLQAFSRLFSIKPMLSYSFALTAFVFLGGAVWLAINNNSPLLPNNELVDMRTTELGTVVEQPEFSVPNEEQKSGNKAIRENESSKDKLTTIERSPKAIANQSSTSRRTEQSQKPTPVYSTIILPFGLTRGDNTTPTEFDVPAKADFVNLKLKFEEGDFTSYFAVIETVEGQKIWSGKILKSTVSKNERTVMATVAARLLKKGDYIITLKGMTKEQTYESAGDYSFSINRR